MADRRKVLKKVSGIAVGTGILEATVSERTVADSEDEGPDVDPDSGPIQVDPGGGGGNEISDEEFVNVTNDIRPSVSTPANNPRNFGFEVCWNNPNGNDICISDSSKFQAVESPCISGSTLFKHNFTFKEWCADPTGGDILCTSLDGWIGIESANSCFYVGTDDTCKKVGCPDWPDNPPGEYQGQPYDHTEYRPDWSEAIDGAEDFFEARSGLFKSATFAAAVGGASMGMVAYGADVASSTPMF